MPICRGSYIVFNIDFDVIEHSKKKSDPRLFWWSKYCNKIFLTSLLLVCAFFLPHQNMYCIIFKVSSFKTCVTEIGGMEQIIDQYLCL